MDKLKIVDCDGDWLEIEEAAPGIRKSKGDLILLVRQKNLHALVLLDREAVEKLKLFLDTIGEVRLLSESVEETR